LELVVNIRTRNKMEKEFNLSEKEDDFFNMDYDDRLYYKKDVKEFIKRVKEALKNDEAFLSIDEEIIDKLAGYKLIEGKK